MTSMQDARIALITVLAEKSPGGRLGRTALMKYFYFLQTLRQLPLGYRFTLYSYGPFDSDVLADLDTAEAIAAVTSSVVYYSGGYGYEIRPGDGSDRAKGRAASFLQRYESDIGWVVSQFGNLNSAELELVSTIVYVDREAQRSSLTLSLEKLSRLTRDVKPHFTEAQVLRQAVKLHDTGLLLSVPR